MCSELWEINGYGNILNEEWPKYDKELIKKDKIEIVIQVDGKVRDRLEMDVDSSEEKVKEVSQESERIKKWFQGKEVTRVLFIPNKLINFILKK
jgi:leucyl-tRNA synthetase